MAKPLSGTAPPVATAIEPPAALSAVTEGPTCSNNAKVVSLIVLYVALVTVSVKAENGLPSIRSIAAIREQHVVALTFE
jgi:hypothetical protein